MQNTVILIAVPFHSVYVTKRCGNDKRITRAEADTGPNDKVNIGLLLLVQGGLPGPNNEEVKIGNQVVSTGLIYVSRQ